MDKGISPKTRSVILAVTCTSFAAALSGYLVLGTFMRYSGDDYCYSAVLVERGFIQSQVYAYLHATTFAGDRFSLNLASFISSLVGPIASAVLPGLILILWVVGMFLTLREAARIIHVQIHPLIILLGVEVTAFFTLYMAPNLGQSLFWRSGMLPYLMPMMVNSYLVALVLNRIRVPTRHPLTWILLLLLSFLAAGFSETVAAMQMGFYIIAFSGICVVKKLGSGWAEHAFWPLTAVLAGTLLAMIVMVLSPANHPRQVGLPPPPGLVRLVWMSLENAVVFIKISLYKQFLPNAICGLMFLALSCLYYISQPAKGTSEAVRFLIELIVSLVSGFLLIVCCMAPSAYALSTYPDLRVLVAPDWVMVMEIGIVGWLIGKAFSGLVCAKEKVKEASAIMIGAAFVVLAIGAVPLVTARDVFAQVPRYQRWAAYWDIRDAQIRNARQENTTGIEVMEIDHIIPAVSELRADPGFWYNVCAARYYRVNWIAANQPGWDK